MGNLSDKADGICANDAGAWSDALQSLTWDTKRLNECQALSLVKPDDLVFLNDRLSRGCQCVYDEIRHGPPLVSRRAFDQLLLGLGKPRYQTCRPLPWRRLFHTLGFRHSTRCCHVSIERQLDLHGKCPADGIYREYVA